MIFVYSFLIGGAICAAAQIVIDKTALAPARILVIGVCLGVFLTAVGVYKPFAEMFGSGATVPITGFGYSLAEGVKKAVDEHGLIGALTGGLTKNSAGIEATIIFGWITAMIFKGKPQR